MIVSSITGQPVQSTWSYSIKVFTYFMISCSIFPLLLDVVVNEKEHYGIFHGKRSHAFLFFLFGILEGVLGAVSSFLGVMFCPNNSRSVKSDDQ